MTCARGLSSFLNCHHFSNSRAMDDNTWELPVKSPSSLLLAWSFLYWRLIENVFEGMDTALDEVESPGSKDRVVWDELSRVLSHKGTKELARNEKSEQQG